MRCGGSTRLSYCGGLAEGEQAKRSQDGQGEDGSAADGIHASGLQKRQRMVVTMEVATVIVSIEQTGWHDWLVEQGCDNIKLGTRCAA
jgi:hypothetical protein